jgi:hypothetical protein|eukprot:scaffold3718_cov187-Alexandrium_tamarense.AAC.6
MEKEDLQAETARLGCISSFLILIATDQPSLAGMESCSDSLMRELWDKSSGASSRRLERI